MILFSEVTKKYGKEVALDEVSLQFTPGKIYGLVGPNGSGKSTTLKLITGLAYPNKGKITVLGEEVTRRTCRHVAYLTELDMFYENFTIEEAIDFYSTQFPDFRLEKAKLLLTNMNLDGKKKIRKLSKGHRSRVKLLLTLARESPLVLLDEPFSGLDPLIREEIVKNLLTYIDLEEQTVLITTHEIDEIESILDEVIVIYQGKILAREEVENLRWNYGLSVKEWFKKLIAQQEE